MYTPNRLFQIITGKFHEINRKSLISFKQKKE